MISPTEEKRVFSIWGAPDEELNRSPAAQLIGGLAAQSELFLSHFEYRRPLPPPKFWLPGDRTDLGEVADWHAGILPESKYQNSRNDLLIGSFHPGHRAKWTAHELCHGLVGFAWKPGASPFFHALSARLSELLPVALFYYFDEAFLRSCPDHPFGGPLFGPFCPKCDEAAAQGPCLEDPRAEAKIAQGKAFVEAELAAVSRSIRLGRPIANPWNGLDLSSDSLAYAAAQSLRLNSPEFERYIEMFFPPGHGRHDSLESLEARVLELCGALCGEHTAEPLPGDKWRYICQDLGWRLFEFYTQCEPAIDYKVMEFIEELARNPSRETVELVIDRYIKLNDEWVLLEPEKMFSLGYPLAGSFGLDHAQIAEGIESAFPASWDLLGHGGIDGHVQLMLDFAAADKPRRKPLARRFADWMAEHHPGPASEAAAFEAALMTCPAADTAVISLTPSDWETPLTMGADPHAMLQLADDVQLITVRTETARQLDLLEDYDMIGATLTLAIRRFADGNVGILPLSEDLASQLTTAQQPTAVKDFDLDEEDHQLLRDHRLIVPVKWTL